MIQGTVSLWNRPTRTEAMVSEPVGPRGPSDRVSDIIVGEWPGLAVTMAAMSLAIGEIV